MSFDLSCTMTAYLQLQDIEIFPDLLWQQILVTAHLGCYGNKISPEDSYLKYHASIQISHEKPCELLSSRLADHVTVLCSAWIIWRN